ncbi:retron St85 family effector protein [Bradyrhizobium sp. CCBAU 25360]|uniref:retron St85 family effector protein n=1 Tax=Bradyrhizobium sp. CCBAU 25360 TaxID=858425 RepID=UPI002305DA4C|nr:retron St85 family effector protein [Bradyrhizobium sp. CCBAU 25360]
MVAELRVLYDDLRLDGVRVSRPSKFMFLCGGYISKDQNAKPVNLRDYLFRVRQIANRYNIVLAEKATQLFRDSEYGDLISFEEDIARISAVVLVIAESPGSLAELGAFTANETIRSALRVVIQQQHEIAESFVRYGPIERIKNAKRANLAVYPWRVHANGTLNLSSTKPHYAQIVKFLDEHVSSVPASTIFTKLGEAEIFYVIYWIVHLCLAVSTTQLRDYVRLILPSATDETIKNKLYCMQLAGWIERRSYSNKDYLWALHDADPFEYEFKPGVSERVSVRRKLTVTAALRKAVPLPSHIRTEATAARLAATA